MLRTQVNTTGHNGGMGTIADLTYTEVAKEVEDIQGRIRRLAHNAPNNPEIQTRFSTAHKRLETARRYSRDLVVPSEGDAK